MDYYEILGVSREATTEELSKAYRSLALRFHPDRHPDPETAKKAAEKFKEVTNAFTTLNDPGKRAIYNAKHPPKHPTVKTRRMTEEERYNYIMKQDPNFGPKSYQTPSPPKFDIWGRRLTREEQEQWIRDNISESPILPPKMHKRTYTAPQRDQEFIDVFAKYYEKQSMPHLNRG